MSNKTRQLQNRINKIQLLQGYQVERQHHAFYLRHQVFGSIYLQNSRVAEKWLANVELTGRDNAALRRFH